GGLDAGAVCLDAHFDVEIDHALDADQDFHTLRGPGDPLVALRQAVDQHAHAALVEADLAGVRGGAQRVGPELDDGRVAACRHGGRGTMDDLGELGDLTEACTWHHVGKRHA